MNDLTWTCHVCGEERPDARISVYTTQVTLAGGVQASMNVRYCNDRQECKEGAPKVDFFEGRRR